MKKRIVFGILITGLSGIIAQILILRELLITFYGNELTIGIILANWLILEAVGAFFLGKGIERFKKKLEAFVALIIIFSVSFPIAIYLTRIIKEVMGIIPGEGVGLIPIFISSFFILLPVSISHGALFTFGCKIYSLYSKREPAASVGRVYIYETLGTIAGGVGLTYLLIPYFHSIETALGVSLLNIILCIYLKPARIFSGISVILLALIGSLIFSGAKDKIHASSINGQWKGQKVLHYQNSIYGNVAVTRRQGQYTFFSDGIPIITSPSPDTVFMEEFAHLPLLSHRRPEEILVISGGAGGMINEILKHPSVERVDYAELDPLILEVVEKFVTPLTKTELRDKRVNIKYVDGRLFVKNTPRKYDLILIGLSNPSDLGINRFFTKEFFALAKKKLKKEGILVISLPGSLTYLGEELRDLNACIINTLKEAYPYVRIIPGDFNLFLASASREVTLADHAEFGKRLGMRKLKVSFLTPAHIEYRLSPKRVNWFLQSIEGGTEKINRDFLPRGLFYNLSYWNALFSPRTQKIFKVFEKISLRLIIIPVALFTVVFLLFASKVRRIFNSSIPLCITATGFAGILFNLVLIFAFQALYGYVFHWIGLLVTTLMVGIAAGSLRMTSLLGRIKNEFGTFIKLEVFIILFSASLPALLLIFHPLIFIALSFISGFLVGAQFPLANKMYLALSAKRETPDLSGTAGLLYGADLAGGWLGGIIGGVILLPLLGLFGTCMVVVTLKAASLIILAASARSAGCNPAWRHKI
ncbi:MAG: spermine synthase [Candidatus Omnitrophota bacterium]|nr:MAG: spermine synthase [Candidatus Omnitrophota bacterium]